MDTGATTTPEGPGVGPLPLWVAVGVLGAVGMVLAGSGIGSIPHPASDTWWFTVRIGTGTGAHLAFYASLLVLLAGWAGVGAHAYRGRLSVPAAWLVLGLWGLPFFLGAPLFSRDLYSYIAQGQLARHGLNPYLVAPSALGPGNLLSSIATVWKNTASPYGPLFVSVSRLGAVGGRGDHWSPRSSCSGPSNWSAWPSSWSRCRPWPAGSATMPAPPCGWGSSARWPSSASSRRATTTP